MSRIARIAFLAIVVLALTALAGFDLRLALANRDLAIETGAVLDQHERHPNGIGVVTDRAVDESDRRVAANRRAAANGPSLDENERRARAIGALPSVPAALDEHDRPAWRERQTDTR
jgi:hypothetical protein